MCQSDMGVLGNSTDDTSDNELIAASLAPQGVVNVGTIDEWDKQQYPSIHW
jgi:hypothetical protein